MTVSPTRVLMDEHQTILRVLACTERLVTADVGKDVGVVVYREIVDFLRTYADRLHHGKEEELLFPAMERNGLPHDQGPTAVMRYEHQEGRLLVRMMAAAVELPDAAFRRETFRGPALDFVELLRGHIAKEDHILFPMADRALGDADRAHLETEYARVEAEGFDAEVHTRYETWAWELAKKLGIHDERFEVVPACHG